MAHVVTVYVQDDAPVFQPAQGPDVVLEVHGWFVNKNLYFFIFNATI